MRNIQQEFLRRFRPPSPDQSVAPPQDELPKPLTTPVSINISGSPSRDWWSASGTGWGPNHDRPNPYAVAAKHLAQDARETIMDVRDEPEEVLYRIGERLKAYLPGTTQGMRKQ